MTRKIDEIFFDLHVRGCKPAHEKSNKICEEAKQDAKQQLLEAILECLPEKEIFEVKKRLGVWGSNLEDIIAGWNQAIAESRQKVGELFE